jgi:hypothetical protein
MVARLIKQTVVLLSIALAAGLIVLWSTVGGRDWVISRASRGIYGELRCERSGLRWTTYQKWPIDERLNWGRTPEPKPFGYRIRTAHPAPLMLLTGEGMVLPPTRKNIGLWHESGIASMQAGRQKYATPSPPLTGTLVNRRVLVAQSGAPLPSATPAETKAMAATVPVEPHLDSRYMAAPVTAKARFDMGLPSLHRPNDGRGDASALFKESSELTIVPKIKPGVAADTSLRLSFGGSGQISFPYESFATPYWAAALATLTPAWIALLAGGIGWRKRRLRRRRGLCMNCGYDLRGTPEVCPECGTTIASIDTPRASNV